MSLEGKVAIVTGASRGIGKQIALQLAEMGANIAVNYTTGRVQADETVADIQALGREAVAVAADISRLGDIERLFAETIARFGKVDILVNNAGYLENGLIGEVSEASFDKHFAINVKGTYFAIQQAMKHMEPNGRIVNFSTSVTGLMLPSYSVYAATKGAVEQMTRQLAKEFGPKGITINCIAPGPVNTELFRNGKSPEQIDAVGSMNAFHRLAETEDIAPAITFLVSEQARWITGQTIRVNGGYV